MSIPIVESHSDKTIAGVVLRRYIVTFAEDRFTAMDVQRSGKINVVAVRSFVKSMSPGVSDAQVGFCWCRCGTLCCMALQQKHTGSVLLVLCLCWTLSCTHTTCR